MKRSSTNVKDTALEGGPWTEIEAFSQTGNNMMKLTTLNENLELTISRSSSGINKMGGP